MKAGYFELFASIAKGVLARGLVLNRTCCIDLPDCIASQYISEHTIIINKHI